MRNSCGCIPGPYDPLSKVLRQELDTGEERRKAQDWAEEARRHAEAAAQSEAAAGAGAEAAAKSWDDAAASAGLAQAEAERAKGYADGAQADYAYIEQARQAAQAAAKEAGEAAAKVSEADIDGKLAEMQKTEQTVKADAGRAADAAAGAATSAADAAGSAAESQTSAGEAMASRDAAKASESAAAAAADRAEKAVWSAQTAAQGQKGYFDTADALRETVPAGTAGDWAIVGSTDTVWVWDADTKQWTDSGSRTDLSNYYTKDQANEMLAEKQDKLAGTAGQVVGFDESGNAVASDQYYTKEQTDAKITELNGAIEQAMNKPHSRSVAAMLTADGWSPLDAGAVQDISIEGLTADQNGIVGLGPEPSDEQLKAARAAGLYLKEQKAGTLTIGSDGKTPGCDIPVVVILFE